MRTITADLYQERGPRDCFGTFCVGAGRANEALRYDFTEHLKTAIASCGFRYLRFHGLFHDDMAVYREDRDGHPIYNWQYLDAVFDKLLALGIRPFVELSFTPRALASGEKTIFWWRGNVTMPKDLAKWGALVEAFAQHCLERYGHDEVAQWFFEVWNEPDYPAFFAGDMHDYFRLYDAAARAVKSVSPVFRVGGPATSSNRWIPDMIEHCVSDDVPLDFISTHTYGVEGALDEFGRDLHRLLEDPDTIVRDVRRARRQILDSAMPHLPLYYTEWSASYSSRDNVHDSYVSAPYILYNLKRIEGSVDAMSYWTFTDVFEEGGPAPTPFHGGFGMLNLQGLKKPAFYAYEFYHALGARELTCEDPDAWVCHDGDDIQALFWNYRKPRQGDVPNEHYFTRDLPPQSSQEVSLAVESLTPGTYLYTERRIGYGKADVFDAYRELGCPENLTREQVAALALCSRCTPVCELITVDGTFSREFSLAENEVCLVELKKL